MTNHLIDVEEAEAECIRFAHALFLELNRPETSPEKLRSAPVNDARYRKKMHCRKNLGGMWRQFGFGGAYDFMFMEDSQDADCIAPSKDVRAAQMQCLNHWGKVLYALVPSVEEVQQALRKSLLKYKLHKDQILFERAYHYIKEYYLLGERFLGAFPDI